ncbi:MAG: GNAT family N-acetyltransferase [Anaerolineae bacterium]|nr:GNAT family N-acetyltransferase [Anaerolineae bacterium]
MRLKRFDRGSDFYERAKPFLLKREAEHNLILGIAAGIASGAEWVHPPPYLALVEEEDEPVAAAVMTPPHNLILSDTDYQEALTLFASDLLAGGWEPPGVTGPVELARAFADIWRERTGRSYNVRMAQRIFKLERVRPPEGVPGQLRRATESDRPLLRRWFYGFDREAAGGVGDPDRSLDRFLTSGSRGLYLWEDGEPVSMAGCTGPTPHGMRIGAVYTPPEKRRRGYASACVAAVSQLVLDSGRQFCFLYTDLANPTSNHIYREIGYEPVADSVELRFEAGS